MDRGDRPVRMLSVHDAPCIPNRPGDSLYQGVRPGASTIVICGFPCTGDPKVNKGDDERDRPCRPQASRFCPEERAGEPVDETFPGSRRLLFDILDASHIGRNALKGF